MEKYCATSDVKCTVGADLSPQSAGLTSNVLPEVQKPTKPMDSQTGVSTNNVLSLTSVDTNKDTKDTPHWYALRTTYGREKKAYNYLLSKNVVAFYPTLKSVKLVDSKRITVEESRIPNIFFAYGTEEDLKTFVYDNVNLPYLRFYYRHTHVGNKIVKEPLVVPEVQMNSLKIICAADSDDIVASTEEIRKFKVGQKVRITEGKFKGVVGMVARYHSQQRVGIVIDGLLTVCTAYVPSAFIEIVE
ncbi:MAG: UpxY family transcription antiterminator [Prevotella sp.]|nr:UpxY family transcription antiterminator [Prevotella sp.]